jgi:putative ABC transport system permease protein
MVLKYFAIALRSIRKNKSTGMINLLGLSIGITASIFILLWVGNEISFDKRHPNSANIYRITNHIQVNKEESWAWESSPMLLAAAAQKEIPEIEGVARIMPNVWGGQVFKINNTLFSEKSSAYIDPGWFNLFKYDFLAGNAAGFTQNPFSIILTESKAKKYFGNSNAIGQLIKVDTVNYQVAGIVKDIPINSSFQFDILLQMDGRLANPETYKNDKNWNNFGYATFIAINKLVNYKKIENELTEIINKNRTNNNDVVSLLPLSKMYFDNSLQSSDFPHGNKKTTYLFSAMAFLLLLSACINYVNLTTAKASLRAKEVGIRKITGAKRRDLFFQFLAESFCISCLAILCSLFLLQIALPIFNSITEKQFELNLNSLLLWKVLAGTLFFAALFNGIYPALLLSSFQPLQVFRGRSILKLRDGAFRNGLVVFQFSLSIVLIIGSIVIFRQLAFIQHSHPGYSVAQVISVKIPYNSYRSLDEKMTKNFFRTIKNELGKSSAIAAVSTGGAPIVAVSSASSGNADWDGRDTTYNPTIAMLSVDADFQQMFKVRLAAGHWFKTGTEDTHNYLLNETAVAAFNCKKPVLGQRFTWGGDTGRIVGIVKDFHFKSMREKIGPMVLSNNSGADDYFFIKTTPGNSTAALHSAEKVWTKFIPNEPFDYTFLEDSFNTLYKDDVKTSRLILIFSLIAIIISALGLFGLAAFTAERRTKEIGIRKVLGATITQITSLLSKDFLKLVILAIFVGSPIAWYTMNRWLQDFAYRIDISVWMFLVAGILSVAIAMIAVSFQSVKAAVANPAESLKSE